MGGGRLGPCAQLRRLGKQRERTSTRPLGGRCAGRRGSLAWTPSVGSRTKQGAISTCFAKCDCPSPFGQHAPSVQQRTAQPQLTRVHARRPSAALTPTQCSSLLESISATAGYVGATRMKIFRSSLRALKEACRGSLQHPTLLFWRQVAANSPAALSPHVRVTCHANAFLFLCTRPFSPNRYPPDRWIAARCLRVSLLTRNDRQASRSVYHTPTAGDLNCAQLS